MRYTNAVYKTKFRGFRLGATAPPTGKLLYCNDNGGLTLKGVLL